jgi:hypothetical protein
MSDSTVRARLERQTVGDCAMGAFEEREESFERRFAIDEALNFKARARRNRLLGLWAAELMAKSGVEAEAYAGSLVDALVEKGDDESLFERIQSDLQAAGATMSDHRIRRKIEETLARARKDVSEGR